MVITTVAAKLKDKNTKDVPPTTEVNDYEKLYLAWRNSVKVNTNCHVVSYISGFKPKNFLFPHEEEVNNIFSVVEAQKLRVDVMLHAMLCYPQERVFVYTDSDCLIRDSLDDLEKEILAQSVPMLKVWCRYEKRDNHRFNSGFFALQRCEESIEFLKKWSELNEHNVYFLDEQLNMYRAWQQSKIALNAFSQTNGEYDRRYNDSQFKESSSIWHLKGVPRGNWINEFNHYLNHGN